MTPRQRADRKRGSVVRVNLFSHHSAWQAVKRRPFQNIEGGAQIIISALTQPLNLFRVHAFYNGSVALLLQVELSERIEQVT